MKWIDSFRRWSLMTFLPTSVEKKQARITAQLWRNLRSDRPLWYDPVTDRLTPDFALALANLKVAVEGLASLSGVGPAEAVPPSLMPRLVGRVLDAYLASCHLDREKLSFVGVHAEVSALKGADYRGMQHLLQTRIQTLPKTVGAQWEKALPSLEGLVHLSAFDWAPLARLLAVAGGKASVLGCDHVDALEDLVFVLEPITVDATLEAIVVALEPGADKKVAALRAARAPFLADGQLLNVIRAIRGAPDHPFRRAVYEPPTLSAAVRDLIAGFDAELTNHRNETERLRLAARMKEVFGNRELVPFPSYNEETSAQLVARRLPELTHVGAVKVLHNFHEAFQAPVFQPLFAGLPLQLDFLTPDAKAEFQAHLDGYFAVNEGLKKFFDDMISPTYSHLAPVKAALAAPFLDQRTKGALKKPIEDVNKRADDLCRQATRVFKGLHLAFSQYELDLTDAHPRFFSGGAVLVSKHPQLVAGLKTAVVLLKGLTGLLRQLVADPEENP